MTRVRPLSLVALIAFLGGCAGIRYDGTFVTTEVDWTTEGGSPRRMNVSAEELAPPFELIWTYNAQGGILATPLVRDSVVVVATLHGELQLVSLTDGKRLGYTTLSGPLRGTPVLSGVNVIATASAEEHSVQFIGLREGRPFWRISPGPIESSPLLLEDRVYVSTLGGELLSIDRANGEVTWRFAPRNTKERKPFRSSPASAGGIVVCGSDDGVLYAVDAADGSPRWASATSGAIFCAPVIVDEVVLVSNLAGDVCAFDLTSGKELWTRKMGAPLYASPVSDGVHAYVASSGGVLAALRVSDGAENWSWTAGSALSAPPLVTEHYLYIGSLEKKFLVLDKQTGHLVWTMDLEGRMKVSPVIWNGRVIIVHENRTVAALRPVER